jgi:hypothetical protein
MAKLTTNYLLYDTADYEKCPDKALQFISLFLLLQHRESETESETMEADIAEFLKDFKICDYELWTHKNHSVQEGFIVKKGSGVEKPFAFLTMIGDDLHNKVTEWVYDFLSNLDLKITISVEPSFWEGLRSMNR